MLKPRVVRSRRLRLPIIAAALLLFTAPAFGQTPAPDPPPAAAPNPPETELNLINLPTTLSIKRHRSYFRLTHRFAADLRRGTFGELAADLFTIDKGAIIGLEYRFAITGDLQAGVHRSMLSKTIQTFARWDALKQGASLPVSVSVTGSYEGLNNLRQRYQPGVAVTVSRTFGNALALYATPAFVSGTHAVDFIAGHDEGHVVGLEEDEHATHDDTGFVGLGARVRFSRSGYLVGEYTPRISGYDPNKAAWGVAIEKWTGGHTLQLNFTNVFGTTLGQLARGGSPHDVYLGFNITRKF
jgi:uncharacterized beta barrel domain-containing protein DUF5777